MGTSSHKRQQHQNFEKKRKEDPMSRFSSSFDKDPQHHHHHHRDDERIGTEISEEYPEDFDEEIESESGIKESIDESIQNTKDMRSSVIKESIGYESGRYFGSGSGIKESIEISRRQKSIDEEINMTESINMSASKSGIHFRKSSIIEEDIDEEGYSDEKFESINESIQESSQLKALDTSHRKSTPRNSVGASPIRDRKNSGAGGADGSNYSKFRGSFKDQVV